MSVAIIDFGAGNLRSAQKAFEHAIAAAGRAEEVIITADPAVVARADRVVLPGDGAFADCKRNLLAIPGMIEAIDETIDVRGRPFLGICVGMQLLATRGVEHAITAGLDRIPGEVRAVKPDDPALKVPHMGWNQLRLTERKCPLFKGLSDLQSVYFCHSYYPAAGDRGIMAAMTKYGIDFPSVIRQGQVFATQFHPEKSQKAGLKILENFVDI